MGGEREKRRCRKVWRNSEMGEKRNKVVDEVGEGDVWYGSRRQLRPRRAKPEGLGQADSEISALVRVNARKGNKTMSNTTNSASAPIRGSFEPDAFVGFWTDIAGVSRGFVSREEALAFIEARRPAAAGGGG